jgi:hypothetical protein
LEEIEIEEIYNTEMVDDERDGKRRVKKSEGGLEYLVSNII